MSLRDEPFDASDAAHLRRISARLRKSAKVHHDSSGRIVSGDKHLLLSAGYATEACAIDRAILFTAQVLDLKCAVAECAAHVTCIATSAEGRALRPPEPMCDEHCGHGNEDATCFPVSEAIPRLMQVLTDEKVRVLEEAE